MSLKCPLCGNSKTKKGLFCKACTEKLNSEYEVKVPSSEEADVEEAKSTKLNVKESHEETPQSAVEERAKVTPAPNFDKRAWRNQREDKRSDSDKSYYELSKEKKSNKVLFATLAVFVLFLALFAGLYIYNNNVKNLNLERSRWELAQRENNVDGYLTYMKEYPQGKFIDEAYNNMLALKNRETEAFEDLKTSENTIEFTDFMEQYPESPYERKVKSRLDSLIWQSSLKENSAEAYSNYINKSTLREILGDYIGEAEKRFKMLDQSTPIDEEDLVKIRAAVDGFFTGVSTLSHTALNEYLAPVVIRFNNQTNLSSKEIIGQLLLQASKENAKSLRFDADVTNIKYEKMGNDTYQVNIPVQKIFEGNGGGTNHIKGYIVHLKLSPDFKVFSFHETKPYTEAP